MRSARTGRNASQPCELRETRCHANADEDATEAKSEDIGARDDSDTDTAASAAAKYFS